ATAHGAPSWPNTIGTSSSITTTSAQTAGTALRSCSRQRKTWAIWSSVRLTHHGVEHASSRRPHPRAAPSARCRPGWEGVGGGGGRHGGPPSHTGSAELLDSRSWRTTGDNR